MTSRLAMAAAVIGLASATSATAAESPIGVWLDDTGRGAIEISECGQGKLCGKLVWIQNGRNAKACGTPIIGDVAKVDGEWDGGWIYSPEKDSKYDVALTPAGPNKLKVLGYAGSKLFSKEMVWTRAPGDLKRCDQQIEAKAAPVAPAPAAPTGSIASATATPPLTSTAPPPKSGGAKSAVATPAPTPSTTADPPAAVAAAAPPVAAKTPDQEKADAETWASEPGNVKTAQADVAAEDKPAKVHIKTRKKKLCRVDAPFVRVEFPCDDD